MTLFGRLDRYDQARPFLPWARRVMANVAITSVRRRRPDAFTVEDVEDWRGVADSRRDHSDTVAGEAVVEAVEGLSDPLRVVVVLRYWLDLTIPEIAEALEIAEGQLRRG